MKVRITRFVEMAAIAALLFFAGSPAAWAQTAPPPACSSSTTSTITYTPDFSSSQGSLMTNGTATTSGNALQLTSSTGDQTGSAWYTTAQNVEQGFSTCFQFVFSNSSTPPADGIAFVIQNASAGTSAIGFAEGNGGALGYGEADASTVPSQGAGIPNSLAIEFDTFENSWDPEPMNGSASHVAVQSCGTGPNTSHHGEYCGGTINGVNMGSNSTLGAPVPVPNMADGKVHTVMITYIPACPSPLCNPGINANIHVILDGVDLYPSGVQVDLSTIGLGQGNTAYVGFTGATGGDDETQDVLNWTYTPQAQTVVLSSTPTTLSFPNADNTVVYTFGFQGTGSGPTLVTVQPNLMTRAACDAIVQKTFFPASCFVYQNAAANGKDAAVMFAFTCPMGGCDSLNAEFSAGYSISKTGNPFFVYPGIAGLLNPFPGLLKSSDPTPAPQNPCAAPVFVSNQIDYFVNDNGFMSGKSGGTGSCWVATYDTPGEALPPVQISSPTIATYTQNQTVPASYRCSNPKTSQASGGPVGPYLTVASCTQNQAPVPSGFSNTNNCSAFPPIFPATGPGSSPVTCSGLVDTSILGLHAFWVTATDSGGNTNVQAVAYLVVKKR
jgi:Bacterial lectin